MHALSIYSQLKLGVHEERKENMIKNSTGRRGVINTEHKDQKKMMIPDF